MLILFGLFYFCICIFLHYSTISGITEGFRDFLTIGVSDGSTALGNLLLLKTRNNIINTEKHTSRFDGSLINLELDGNGFPDIGFTHVSDLTTITFNTNKFISFLVVLGSQFSDSSNDINTAVLSQSLGDSFQSVSNSSEGELTKTFNGGRDLF